MQQFFKKIDTHMRKTYNIEIVDDEYLKYKIKFG